jgi:hypothetical protein
MDVTYLVYTVSNAYYALVVPSIKDVFLEDCHVMSCSPIPEVAKRHLAPDNVLRVSLDHGCRIGCCETRHIAIGIDILPVKLPDQKPKRPIVASWESQERPFVVEAGNVLARLKSGHGRGNPVNARILR